MVNKIQDYGQDAVLDFKMFMKYSSLNLVDVKSVVYYFAVIMTKLPFKMIISTIQDMVKSFYSDSH